MTQMTVAVGQMQVSSLWQENLATIGDLASSAAEQGARLLCLPEGVIARDPSQPNLAGAQAQEIDGPFVSGLAEISARTGIALSTTVHIAGEHPKPRNVHLVLDQGEIIAQYVKLHLYDAFTSKESDNVEPGDQVPPIVEIDGISFGLMTCYDVRFPELARSLTVAGADVLLLPAAWVRGSLKEQHWQVMTTARAMENTVYVIACGEVSARNIGRSLVIDPLGVTVAAAAEEPQLFTAVIDTERIDRARTDLPVLANTRFASPELEPVKELLS